MIYLKIKCNINATGSSSIHVTEGNWVHQDLIKTKSCHLLNLDATVLPYGNAHEELCFVDL
jgi:hypothetical protein